MINNRYNHIGISTDVKFASTFEEAIRLYKQGYRSQHLNPAKGYYLNSILKLCNKS